MGTHESRAGPPEGEETRQDSWRRLLSAGAATSVQSQSLGAAVSELSEGQELGTRGKGLEGMEKQAWPFSG